MKFFEFKIIKFALLNQSKSSFSHDYYFRCQKPQADTCPSAEASPTAQINEHITRVVDAAQVRREKIRQELVRDKEEKLEEEKRKTQEFEDFGDIVGKYMWKPTQEQMEASQKIFKTRQKPCFF